MENKFSLKRNENIFLAKKLMADSIYCGIKMEGAKITFPETQTILDGVNVPNATLDNIQAILNMRDAWKFLLDTIDEPFNIEYICKINSYVARNESLEWGVLRTGNVGISGVKYVPKIPDMKNVTDELANIMSDNSVSNTIKAIRYFLWGARSQLFWDGNKRTSLICANKILIQNGNGIMTIHEDNIGEFNNLLANFYETNNTKEIELFLYNTGIRGITFN